MKCKMDGSEMGRGDRRHNGSFLALLFAAGLLIGPTAWAQGNGGDGAEPPAAPVALALGAGWAGFNWGSGEPVLANETFTFDGAACLSITDAFFPGDRFEVLDNGGSIGLASNPTLVFEGSIATNPDDAFHDPRYSSETFVLPDAAHSITINVIANPFNSGGAFIRIDECPPEARATLAVSKDFTDDNTAEVNVTLSCNTGLPIEQSTTISEGDGVEFVVLDFNPGELECELTEGTADGYNTQYFVNGFEQDGSCSFRSGFETAFTCEIVNSPAPVTVTVNKEWVIANAGSSVDQRWAIDLDCDAEIVGSDEGGGDGDGTVEFLVIPSADGSTCGVAETSIFDNSVESDDSDCQDLQIGLGQGAECTIVNTVFFEDIPALNRYGLAMLALLMLGVGFVGYRRFA
jgi:hypothetical protein